jgi:uncharacterized protein YbjQ (UPF0145 family)
MELLFFAGFLFTTWFAGELLERRHLASLDRRERRSRNFPATTCEELPGFDPTEATLVTGSVVVSPDYFRRFAAALRNLFGGPIPGFERTLECGRREAILRMKETAHAAGYRAVVNVRVETARLASSTRGGEGTTGVELLAVGTALRGRR